MRHTEALQKLHHPAPAPSQFVTSSGLQEATVDRLAELRRTSYLEKSDRCCRASLLEIAKKTPQHGPFEGERVRVGASRAMLLMRCKWCWHLPSVHTKRGRCGQSDVFG